jgi:hypothetical protein
MTDDKLNRSKARIIAMAWLATAAVLMPFAFFGPPALLPILCLGASLANTFRYLAEARR